MTFGDFLRIIDQLPDEALQPVADFAMSLIQQSQKGGQNDHAES